MTELPKFRFWAHRAFYELDGYEAGFFCFPRPRQDQVEGEYIKALIHVRVSIRLPRRGWPYISFLRWV